MNSGAGVYSKIHHITEDVREAVKALFSEELGRLGGDQRETLKVLYHNVGSLALFYSDVLTNLEISRVAGQPDVNDKFNEIYQPIAAIIQSLLDEIDGPLGDMQAEIVVFMQQGLLDVARYWASIWAFSRLHEGLESPRATAFDLNRLVQECVRAAGREDITVRPVPGDAPVVADHEWLAACLMELLMNAARHAPGAPVMMQVSRRSEAWVVQCVDAGPGIAATSEPRLLEPFYQYDENAPGIGLGLTICSMRLELMRGALSVVSLPGIGTRFVIEIPALPALPRR